MLNYDPLSMRALHLGESREFPREQRAKAGASAMGAERFPRSRSFAARSRVVSRLTTIVLLAEVEEHCENYGLKPRSNNQPGARFSKVWVFFRTRKRIFKSKSKE